MSKLILCPQFDCLDMGIDDGCMNHDGCDSCKKFGNCDYCSRQASLVGGAVYPCDMIHLPPRCRNCSKRTQDGFEAEVDCAYCSHKKRNS